MELQDIHINGKVYSKDQFVDAETASEFLGISKRTLEKLVSRREIKPYKLTRKNSFLLSELWQWAQSRRVGGADPL